MAIETPELFTSDDPQVLRQMADILILAASLIEQGRAEIEEGGIQMTKPDADRFAIQADVVFYSPAPQQQTQH